MTMKWIRPPHPIRGRGRAEPDQDEALEEGIFALVQGKGPDIQAE